jgi:hypothetical protein
MPITHQSVNHFATELNGDGRDLAPVRCYHELFDLVSRLGARGVVRDDTDESQSRTEWASLERHNSTLKAADPYAQSAPPFSEDLVSWLLGGGGRPGHGEHQATANIDLTFRAIARCGDDNRNGPKRTSFEPSATAERPIRQGGRRSSAEGEAESAD